MNIELGNAVEGLIENWLDNRATSEQIVRFSSENHRGYDWAEQLANAMDAQSTESHGKHIGLRLFSSCAFEVFERRYPRSMDE
jgi:hypothetical protein